MEKFSQFRSSNHESANRAEQFSEQTFKFVENIEVSAEKNPEWVLEIAEKEKEKIILFLEAFGISSQYLSQKIDYLVCSPRKSQRLSDQLGGDGFCAHYRLPNRDVVIISHAYLDKKEFLSDVLRHELVHSLTSVHQRATTSVEKDPRIVTYAGYQIVDAVLQEDSSGSITGVTLATKMAGFNEAINEQINIFIDNYVDEHGLDEVFSAAEMGQMYEKQRSVLRAIVSKMSEEQGIEENEIWQAFIKKYINQDYSIYRDMARIFGREFIPLLALMGTYKKAEQDGGENFYKDLLFYINSSRHDRVEMIDDLKEKYL
tara:strand:+ start:314 stop:1261 length:948 start_codon:yes stop_codon:yes gene_type:complete